MTTAIPDRFSGSVVFVTGAGHGIGRATARRFLAEGARVVLADVDLGAAQQVARDHDPDYALAVECDQTSTASVADAVHRADQWASHLDVLANVAGMFAARGFNIDSLVVGRTENPDLSRMTIVCVGDDNTLEQVRKQLAKLVPVVKVRDYKDAAYLERDLALITVGVGPEHRSEVIEIVNLFRGKVVDIARGSVMVELGGTEEKIEAFIELMRPYGILELARTGRIALVRGRAVPPTAEEGT